MSAVAMNGNLDDTQDPGPVAPPRRHVQGSPPLPGGQGVSAGGDVPSQSPMRGAQLVMDYAPPREQSVEEIARRIIHDEQIPLLLPFDYCEALFSSCANEETLRLLRSVYYVHEVHGAFYYVLDQRDVNPHDLSEKSARVMLALRAAAVAVRDDEERKHRDAPTESDDDPASRRRIVQQEHVITLQNRKIQELEARSAHIKEAGHALVGNPATSAELQDAQARLGVLKAHSEQQAADIQKLQADAAEAEQQLASGATINRSIKSLWSDSKLGDENARLIKENEYTQRQIDIKAQHVTEVKFHLDQLKDMYGSTEHLVQHEGGALRNILTQKEAEAERLKVRIAKVQAEIKSAYPRRTDQAVEEFRYRDLQARSRFSEAITHVNQLEHKLEGLRREKSRQTDLYELKQKQLVQAREEVQSLTVQGRGVLQREEPDDVYTDVSIASPYVPSDTERDAARQAAMRNTQLEEEEGTSSNPPQPGPRATSALGAGEIVMAFASYQTVHDDELSLRVGDLVTLITKSEDPGWFEAVKGDTGLKGMVPTTHLKRIQTLQLNEIGTA